VASPSTLYGDAGRVRVFTRQSWSRRSSNNRTYCSTITICRLKFPASTVWLTQCQRWENKLKLRPSDQLELSRTDSRRNFGTYSSPNGWTNSPDSYRQWTPQYTHWSTFCFPIQQVRHPKSHNVAASVATPRPRPRLEGLTGILIGGDYGQFH
jgi:hypothetical protein